MMQLLNSSPSSSSVNHEHNEIIKFPSRGIFKNWISNPLLDDLRDKDQTESIGNKRPRKKKNNYESFLNKKSKIEQEDSTEINEMWSSITNVGNNDKVVKVGGRKKKEKTEFDYEIEKQFSLRKNKNTERNHEAIALVVEKVMAILEIAIEDDIELNKQGKPAINKLMKQHLLNEYLSRKKLQVDFLDHGVLNLLKNWLEPLPDGSLPNITIRSAILNILNHLPMSLDGTWRREQLKKSGLGKVIMFLSQLEEETTSNKKLASELVSKWSRILYNKSTRYEDLLSPEEREEQRQMLLQRENNKTASKPKPQDYFHTDIYILEQPKCSLVPSIGEGRARVPQKMSMDFTIRPKSKWDEKLEARVKFLMADSYIHEKAKRRQKAKRNQRMQAFKISVNGRT